MNAIRNALWMLCLAGFLSPSVQAESLTKADRDQAVAFLERSRAAVLKSVSGLSEAQWNFKPGPDHWSVAEVMEHLAAAEDFLRDMIRDKVMQAPAPSGTNDVKATDELVRQRISDRSHKVQTLEPLRPTNRFGSPEGSRKHFKESREQTIEFVKKTSGLREHAVDSPLGMPLDGYQWVLFMAAHSERHNKQIAEVKADPGFPKH